MLNRTGLQKELHGGEVVITCSHFTFNDETWLWAFGCRGLSGLDYDCPYIFSLFPILTCCSFWLVSSVIFSASGRLGWVCFARIRKEPQDWLWFPFHASCWSRSPFCSSDSPVLRNHQHPDEVNKGRVLSSICPAEIHIPLGLISYCCALTGSVAVCRAAGSGPKTSGAFTRSAGCRGGSGEPGAEPQCQGRG